MMGEGSDGGCCALLDDNVLYSEQPWLHLYATRSPCQSVLRWAVTADRRRPSSAWCAKTSAAFHLLSNLLQACLALQH